jgi:hypothetical protein
MKEGCKMRDLNNLNREHDDQLRIIRLRKIKAMITTLKNSELREIQTFVNNELELSNKCIYEGTEKEE